MPSFGAILTAIVTPFADDGSVDEQAFVGLMAHLYANGSDGFVVCGTTGEASTLTDEEHLRVIELAVAERPEGATIVAGVGSNDTRHAVHLTAGACERGADGLLSVNPYYNRPNRRGILAHYREVSRAADRPIVLYNIPQRTGSDVPNDLLAELAQLDHVEAVKQANNDNLAPVDGLSDLRRQRRDPRPRARHGRGRRDPDGEPHRRPRDAPHGRRAAASAPRSTRACCRSSPRWRSHPPPSRTRPR